MWYQSLVWEVICSNFIVQIFAQFIKPKRDYFISSIYQSPHVSQRRHVRNDIRVHDIHCQSKFYKLKLLEKLVFQQFQMTSNLFTFLSLSNMQFFKKQQKKKKELPNINTSNRSISAANLLPSRRQDYSKNPICQMERDEVPTSPHTKQTERQDETGRFYK